MFEEIAVAQETLIPELLRDITVALEDLTNDLPAFKIKGAYLKREKFKALLKPFLGKKEAGEKDEERFRKAVVKACWRDWNGVTLRNLTRVSEYVMLNYDALVSAFEAKGYDADTEIPFEVADVEWVALKLNNEVFQNIVDELCKMEEYAALKQANEKKE